MWFRRVNRVLLELMVCLQSSIVHFWRKSRFIPCEIGLYDGILKFGKTHFSLERVTSSFFLSQTASTSLLEIKRARIGRGRERCDCSSPAAVLLVLLDEVGLSLLLPTRWMAWKLISFGFIPRELITSLTLLTHSSMVSPWFPEIL